MTVPSKATVRPSLAGLRVVELGQGIAESFTGKMFAAQGADVIKVESPQRGVGSGRAGPDAESHRFGQSPGYFHYLNMSKRSVTLDTGTAEGAHLLERLLAKTDVLVDGTRAGDLYSANRRSRGIRAGIPAPGPRSHNALWSHRSVRRIRGDRDRAARDERRDEIVRSTEYAPAAKGRTLCPDSRWASWVPCRNGGSYRP